MNKTGYKKGHIPWNKGKSPNKETLSKMSQAGMGRCGYWTGKKFSEEYRKKLSIAHKGLNKGLNNYLWKGKDVSYSGLHHWIKREVGKATECENIFCNYPRLSAKGVLMIKPKRYEWANISGNYERDILDYVQLCSSCHAKYDRNKKSIKFFDEDDNAGEKTAEDRQAENAEQQLYDSVN